jgi:hypothetical protein
MAGDRRRGAVKKSVCLPGQRASKTAGRVNQACMGVHRSVWVYHSREGNSSSAGYTGVAVCMSVL